MAHKRKKPAQSRLDVSRKAMGAIMVQFIIDHSLTILISMGGIMGLGLAIDHAMAQFESEESECNANPLD